jgi:hypothetical protein
MLNQDSFNEKHVNVERRCVGAANGMNVHQCNGALRPL